MKSMEFWRKSFSFFSLGSKKRAMVLWKLLGILIAVLVLVTMVFIVSTLLLGGGGEILDSVKRALRFGH